jgi:hypothetical protein
LFRWRAGEQNVWQGCSQRQAVVKRALSERWRNFGPANELTKRLDCGAFHHRFCQKGQEWPEVTERGGDRERKKPVLKAAPVQTLARPIGTDIQGVHQTVERRELGLGHSYSSSCLLLPLPGACRELLITLTLPATFHSFHC